MRDEAVRAVAKFGRIVTDAGWAPGAVLVFRWFAMSLGIREPLDHVIHFSGGMAIAHAIHRILGTGLVAPEVMRTRARTILAFTGACTAALFWEFGEFASDLLRGTHIQHDVAETLWDLIYGTCGAAVSVVLISIVSRRRSARRSQGDSHRRIQRLRVDPKGPGTRVSRSQQTPKDP